MPSDGQIYAAVSRRDALKQVLDFLNSIEGAGYGGMAEFEIARMTMKDEVHGLFNWDLGPEIKEALEVLASDQTPAYEWKIPARDCPNCHGNGRVGVVGCMHCGGTGVAPRS